MKKIVWLLVKMPFAVVVAFCAAVLARVTGSAGGSLPQPGRSSTASRALDATQLTLPVHGEPLRPGWARPAPDLIPRPTYWPMIFGLGVTFFMWGLIANLFVIGLGFTLIVVAAAGWVADLIGEFRV